MQIIFEKIDLKTGLNVTHKLEQSLIKGAVKNLGVKGQKSFFWV